jgi:hypothetical protein
MSTALGRPVGVSVVAIIAIIQATIAIVAGIGFIVERNSDSLLSHVDVSSDTILSYGVGAVIWGIVALFVGLALWKGANWGRIVVAIVEILYLAGGVYLLFAWGGHYLWQGVWQILIALFVLYLLFNPRADEFFEGRRPA